jgi:hypothetical protein
MPAVKVAGGVGDGDAEERSGVGQAAEGDGRLCVREGARREQAGRLSA